MASPPPSPNPSEMRQDHFCCRVVLEFRSHREGLRRKCMRDVGHLPPLASDKVAGSIDADLLEIEEVLGVRYCDPSQMTAVALRNPVDEDDERLEYLVSGAGSAVVPTTVASILSLGFFTAMLDHAGADTVKSAIQEYKDRLDKEFTELAKACDEADDE